MKVKIICLLFFIPFALQAQKEGQDLIDSLLSVLPKQQEDTNKVKVLYRLSGNYSTIDIDKGFTYGQQALQLARKLHWKIGMEKSFNSLGLNAWRKADYPQALDYFDTVITISEQIGDKIMLNKASLNKGSVYNLQGYYPKALEYYMKCLKVGEELGDIEDKALSLHNISSVYLKTNDYFKALDYEKQAFLLYQHLDNKHGLAQSYSTFADAYDGLKNDTAALASYKKAYDIWLQLNDKNGMAGTLNDMAETYQRIKDYKNAADNYLKAIAIEDSLGDEYEMGITYTSLGGVYIDAVRYGDFGGSPENYVSIADVKARYIKNSESWLYKALPINEKNKNFDALLTNYFNLSVLDSIKGDYPGALAMYKKYSAYNDSIFNTNSVQKMQQLEDQRQIDVRDKEIQIGKLTISNDEKQRWMYIAGIVLLFVVAGFIYTRGRQRKKTNTKLQQLNSRLDEANRAKTRFFAILSHDLRSPVANLVNFLFLQKEAPDLLENTNPVEQQQRVAKSAQSFLNILEDVLLWSKGQMNNFKPDIECLHVSSLFAEMRIVYPSTKELQVDFVNPDVEITLNTDTNYLKTIMRNLTANAIKALKDKTGGCIKWTAWLKDGNIYLSISDNGPGMSEAQQKALFSDDESVGTRNGLGLHLIRDLANALNYTIKVESHLQKGTTFTLVVTESSPRKEFTQQVTVYERQAKL